MHTQSHRKGTFQSNGSSPHKSLTTFGSEVAETLSVAVGGSTWVQPSITHSKSDQSVESATGLLSINRIPNQRPGWPDPRTKDEINYEFSIQAEELICHYRCSTVGIKPLKGNHELYLNMSW